MATGGGLQVRVRPQGRCPGHEPCCCCAAFMLCVPLLWCLMQLPSVLTRQVQTAGPPLTLHAVHHVSFAGQVDWMQLQCCVPTARS
jgi:hypothetical protein